jgi:ABC-type microcin C transport system permease subunit YejE
MLRGVDPRGVDPGGVDLRGADLPEVWTSLPILHTLIVALALLQAKLSTTKYRFYPCILYSTTAFDLCWEANMTYPLIR